MTNEKTSLISGDVLEGDMELTLGELCRLCRVPAERVFELVEEGLVEPQGRNPVHWRFQSVSVRRVRCALRLEQDLGVNVAGAALAVNLLEELEIMRARLRRYND